jgi:hypothetical protein
MSRQSDPDETQRFIVIGIAAVLLLMILIIYRLTVVAQFTNRKTIPRLA